MSIFITELLRNPVSIEDEIEMWCIGFLCSSYYVTNWYIHCVKNYLDDHLNQVPGCANLLTPLFPDRKI